MLESTWQFMLDSLFVPGTAVGILMGIGLTAYASLKEWISFGSTAVLKAENARLVAELRAAKDEIEKVLERLQPWIEFETELLAAARATRIKNGEEG